MTTRNPERHPLPSYGLLEMQWCLTRIVSMLAAFEIQEVVEVIDSGGGNDFMLPAENLRFNNAQCVTLDKSFRELMPVPRTP